jgi:ring-1,2-phenylacetyl-CoA epoxidase subunit PaaC
MQSSNDEILVAIAKKSIKEVSYHERFSSDWIKRLGDGTAESNKKMQEAIDGLWRYTDELFQLTEVEKVMVSEGIGVEISLFKEAYYKRVSEVLKEATINIPESKYFQKGGKEGVHSEHMGYILADLQYMQRSYPNMKW